MSLPLDKLARELDWNLLRTFMVIVQAGGITAAADRLLVSQPTVSAALRRLEERLNHRLIERGGSSGFKVTEAGEILYRESVAIYGTIARLLGELGQASPSVSGEIVVFQSDHLALPALAGAIAAFQHANPRVNVVLETTSCADVSQAVNQKRATIGFSSWADPAADLLRHEFDVEPHALYCGPDHPLYQQAMVTHDDLNEAQLVVLAGDEIGGPLEPLTLYRSQIGLRGRIVARVNGGAALLRLIAAGLGVGLLPVFLAEQSGQDLWPVVLPDSELPAQTATPIGAVLNPQTHFEAGERAFLYHLIEAGLCPNSWRPEVER